MFLRRGTRSNVIRAVIISSLILSVLLVCTNVGVVNVNNNNFVYVSGLTDNDTPFDSIPSLFPDRQDDVPTTTSINSVKFSVASHVLENSCKLPILIPDDETIRDVVTHPRRVECDKVQEDYVTFCHDNSTLSINQTLAREVLGVQITCYYRPFAGTLKPDIVDLKPLRDNWETIHGSGIEILDDQFEVKCHAENDTKKKENVFRYAYAQIGHRPGAKYSKNTEERLSVDILVLDSTSLNMFRRHAPKSFRYMKNEMEFYHLEGYNKVADNSMVNLLPILAGLRYLNATYKDHKLESDLPETGVLNFDEIPFIWKDFFRKNCPTMFNDDIMDATRGIFHYPWDVAKGFKEKPTDYFFRPWHVWHRRYPLANASQFCFGNTPYHQQQINLLSQLIKKYNSTCHFSFSFITDLPHDDPSNLERLDDDLKSFLENLYKNNHLNNTVLIIMGDHGHRIHQIMYKYVGRIEERMSLFSVYFPKWFRRMHPDIVSNLEYNKNRLTSNYDVNRMLKDIVDERFDVSPRPALKGVSLFSKIPPNRTCMDANIPDNHCSCLEMVKELTPDDSLYKKINDILSNFTKETLASKKHCKNKVDGISIKEMYIFTSSQMIQHGVRSPTDEFLKRLEKRIEGDVEFVDATYNVSPLDVTVKIRLQHNKKFNTLHVVSDMYLVNFDNLCVKISNPASYCYCFVR